VNVVGARSKLKTLKRAARRACPSQPWRRNWDWKGILLRNYAGNKKDEKRILLLSETGDGYRNMERERSIAKKGREPRSTTLEQKSYSDEECIVFGGPQRGFNRSAKRLLKKAG